MRHRLEENGANPRYAMCVAIKLDNRLGTLDLNEFSLQVLVNAELDDEVVLSNEKRELRWSLAVICNGI